MKKNMSTTDSAIRIFIAVVIAVLYFTDVISGAAALVLGVIALAFLITSFIGFCPLYFPFNIRTNKKRN